MLIGREPEILRLHELVGDHVPVAITGPAGIGKTALEDAALASQPSRHTGAPSSLAWAPLAAVDGHATEAIARFREAAEGYARADRRGEARCRWAAGQAAAAAGHSCVAPRPDGYATPPRLSP